MLQEVRQWVKYHQLQMPVAIFVETFRPFYFLLGQMALAIAPLIPGLTERDLHELGLGDCGEGASSENGKDRGV